LRGWTESGYHIHKDRNLEVCQFCKKPFDQGYLVRLGKFFTVELEETKREITRIIDLISLSEYKGDIGSVEATNFFPDLSAEYLSFKSYAEDQARIIRASVDKMLSSLQDKQDSLHEKTKVFPPIVYPVDAINLLNTTCEKITAVVDKHNDQMDKISEAAKGLELHVIANTLKLRDFFKKIDDTKELDDKLKVAKTDLDKVEANIKSKRASVLNASLAVEKINATLKEFFGESHLYLESDHSGAEVGYVLKRRGKNAKNLSQGEKSIIALMYFLIKLEEDGYDHVNSVVVIDDPVDSQDEVFLFKTFGLIKRHITKIGQIVILTHNFPLFNLIRDWFAHSTLISEAEFYRMHCLRDGGVNKSEIEKLPDLLRKYKTEYQYLFCQLYKFSLGQGGVDEPLVPNIGRKVLEYFAGFKWACSVSEDFSNIVLNRFSTDPSPSAKAMGDFMVKFLHEYSHGQDFTRSISASTFEAKAVCENILLFIKLTDGEHYKKMTDLCI
jgi:wobble nucleotide-excising tRNase